MASPFTIFRKHQKMLIATLGLMAMIAFVFLPIILQGMGLRSNANPVVVKTKRFGNIKEYDLHGMIQQRQMVMNFLERAVMFSGDDPRFARIKFQYLETAIGPSTEEAVVDTWLRAEMAEQLGLRVTDSAINSFLKEVTDNRVTPHQFKEVLKSLHISQRHLFDAMRTELLSLNFRQLFSQSLGGALPAERWEYYQRLNRRVSIEFLPIPVAKYVSRIGDPDEAVLETFFDKYKDKYSDPTSAEPGFREPQKIALEYFKVNQEDIIDPKSVAEEEVKQYYEQFKDIHYLAADEQEGGRGKGKAEGGKAEGGKGKAEGDKSTEGKVPEKEPAKKKSDENKPVEKTDEGPALDAGSGKPADSSSVRPVSPFHLVSMLQEKEEKKPVEAKAKKEPVKEAPKGDAAGEKTKKKAKYVPLEKVEDEIRKRLAREHASSKIEEVLDPLRDMMRQYRDKKIRYDVDKKEAPVELDFPALAAKRGLSAHQTGLISTIQAVQLDIGRSNVEGSIPLVSYAFEKLPEFRPATSQDTEGNHYLFWKTKEVKQRIPKLEDKGVRQRVIWAWKLHQARRLARKDAEKLAAAARKTKNSLKETFSKTPGAAVKTTTPFSWMTYGAVPTMMSQQPPKLSDVDGVDMPGNDFMQTVFDLGAGQVGIAMNKPRTAVYVIRPISITPSPTVLWELFLADDYSKYAAVAHEDQRQIIDAWQEELKTSAGLSWQRKPDQRREE